MRATLTSVRALLRGERLPAPAAGARALRLGVVPDVPVPIGLAALAPASIRLAGELADEWVPFLWARSRIEDGMRRQVQAMIGAAAMGRDPELPASVEPLAREVTLFGTYAEAGEAIAAWFAAGADRLNLCLPPGCSEEEMSEIVEVVARSFNSDVVHVDDSSRSPRA